MTQVTSSEVRRRIRFTFDRVIKGGLRPEAVAGASPEQLQAWAASLGLASLPAAVEEVFGLLGVRQGPWWFGSTAAISRLDGEMRELALECLALCEGTLADPKGLLLVLARGGREFHVVDGADLALDDPPVWRIVEDGQLDRCWNNVSEWFESAALSVITMAESVRRTVQTQQNGDGAQALQQFFRA